MSRDIRLFVKDILDSINKINEFVRDMSFDNFVDDDKTSSAVIKKLEINGEATKNIPKDIQDNYPQSQIWRE